MIRIFTVTGLVRLFIPSGKFFSRRSSCAFLLTLICPRRFPDLKSGKTALSFPLKTGQGVRLQNKGELDMPEFSSSLPSSVKAGHKLNNDELVRAIRYMIAAEYEAVGLYTQLADSIDCLRSKAVLLDVANEERVHAGEFLRLLKELQPDEFVHYDAGAKEVEELLKKVAAKH